MKKKILIVEDEESMLNSMRLILKMADYKVEIARDGQEAFNKVMDSEEKGRQYDLIITDVLMPNLNGLEFLDKLNHEKLMIPVIAITGHADKKMILKLILKGCDAYIIKPIEQDKLIDQVNYVFAEQINSKGFQ